MVKVQTANQLADLRSLLGSSSDKSIAVAYVSSSGLTLIEESIKKALTGQRRKVRFLIGLDEGSVTDPQAVKKLFELSKNSDSLEVKAFIPNQGSETFHPKLFISHSRKEITFLTGSYNLTEAALKRNREHGLQVICEPNEDIGLQTLEAFNGLWEDTQAKLLTLDVVRGYEKYCQNKTDTQSDIKRWADFVNGIPPDLGPMPTWPSLELAYLMGVINARGTFAKEMNRVKIKLEFGTQGTFQVQGQDHFNKNQSLRVRQRIIDEVLGCLPGSKAYVSVSSPDFRAGREPIKVCPSEDQVLFIEFPTATRMFALLFKAFGENATARTAPIGITGPRANRAIVKRFLQGYAVASGTMSDKYPGEVRLSTLAKGDGGPIRDLIESKTKAKSEVRDLRGKEYIAVPMGDFRKAIGFDEKWMDELAKSHQDVRPRSRSLRVPTP